MYEDYYTGQVGGNMAVFRSARYRSDHGLGNVIGGLFRRVLGYRETRTTYYLF